MHVKPLKGDLVGVDGAQAILLLGKLDMGMRDEHGITCSSLGYLRGTISVRKVTWMVSLTSYKWSQGNSFIVIELPQWISRSKGRGGYLGHDRELTRMLPTM